MRVRVFLFMICSITLIGGAGLGWTITTLTPDSQLGLVWFYSSIIVTIIGTAFLISYLLTYLAIRSPLSWHQIAQRLRLAGLLAGFSAVLLALRSASVLSPGWFLILLAAVVVIELAARHRRFKLK